MATVKALLRKDNKLKDGTYPVAIRITVGSKVKYISIGESCTEQQWNRNKGEFNSKYQQYLRGNAKIHKLLAEIQSKIDEYFLKRVEPKVSDLYATEKPNVTVKDFYYFSTLLLSRFYAQDKGGTYLRLRTVINKLKLYAPTLFVEDITPEFLLGYKKYLQNTLKNNPSTVHGNFKKLKQVYIYAIRELNLPPSNVFSVLETKEVIPHKPKLTIDEIEAIRDYSTDNPIWQMRRDMFIFSFYCWGMRFRDLLFLKRENITGDTLSYLTSKSGFKKRITIRMNEYTKAIAAKYSNNGYLFPLLPPHIKEPDKLEQSINSINYSVNRTIKLVALRAGIGKHISFHTARHSFVDALKQNGIPIEMRMQLVGHTSEAVHRRYHDDYDTDIISSAVNSIIAK